MMTLEQFTETHGGYWSSGSEEYPVEDWKYEVDGDATRLGYWEWAYNRYREAEERAGK